MIFIGLGLMILSAASNTVLQTITDDDKRGRVMGFYSMAFMGMAPFGSLMAGAVASKIGAPLTLMGGGALCIVGAAVFASNLTNFRAMIRPIYIRMGIISEVVVGVNEASRITGNPSE